MLASRLYKFLMYKHNKNKLRKHCNSKILYLTPSVTITGWWPDKGRGQKLNASGLRPVHVASLGVGKGEGGLCPAMDVLWVRWWWLWCNFKNAIYFMTNCLTLYYFYIRNGWPTNRLLNNFEFYANHTYWELVTNVILECLFWTNIEFYNWRIKLTYDTYLF